MENQPDIKPVKNLPVIKIIFAILAVIVVGELIWAGMTLVSKSRVQNPVLDAITQNTQPAVQQPAKIALQANKQSLKTGETVTVNILVDTGGRNTDGIDVILNFDPKTLSADKVTTGTIYPNYPVNSVDPAGKVSLSGITSVDKSFSGTGVLGTVTFKAVSLGKTTVALNFSLGNTTDTNIIESKTTKDVLTKVDNLTLQIIP